MPGRYKRRRYGRRKYRRSYRRTGRRGYGRRRSLRITTKKFRTQAVADAVWVKLKYQAFTLIPVTGTTPGILRFRGNSIYDPNQSGTGTQPLAFDQWAAFYKQFYVAASKIKIRAWNSGDQAITLNIFPSVDIISSSDSITYEMWNQPYNKRISLSEILNMKRISHYMTTAKMFSNKLPSADMEFYCSAIADVPSDHQWYWNVQAMGFAGQTVTAMNLSVECEVTYYVKCIGRNTLPAS